MFKHLLAITAATLIALAIAPANATHKDGPHGDSQFFEAILNLLEPKTIFVSSTTQNGDMGGLAGADMICQDLADAAGSIVREGEYVALLSTDDVNASERITPSTGPYIRPDGVPVAANFAALFATGVSFDDRALIDRVNMDETGGSHFDERVWTGTVRSGRNGGNNCMGWNAAGGTGFEGDRGRTIFSFGEWLYTGFPGGVDCGADLRIYCVRR